MKNEIARITHGNLTLIITNTASPELSQAAVKAMQRRKATR